MTRPRIFGEDSPFGQWMRNHRDLDSVDVSLSVTDRDFSVQHYKTVVDGLGTRQVQCMFGLEVKTRSALPSHPQQENKWFEHQRVKGISKVKNLVGVPTQLRHYGHYFLSLQGTEPDESYVTWIQFNQSGGLDARTISLPMFLEILRFERTPDTLEKIEFRRHHKTRELIEVVQAPLGFLYERRMLRRS